LTLNVARSRAVCMSGTHRSFDDTRSWVLLEEDPSELI